MKRALLISVYALAAAFVIPVGVSLVSAGGDKAAVAVAEPMEVSVPVEEFVRKLNGRAGAAFTVTRRDAGGHVLSAEYCGEVYTAARLAEVFGLGGELFSINSENGFVVFTVSQ